MRLFADEQKGAETLRVRKRQEAELKVEDVEILFGSDKEGTEGQLMLDV